MIIGIARKGTNTLRFGQLLYRNGPMRAYAQQDTFATSVVNTTPGHPHVAPEAPREKPRACARLMNRILRSGRPRLLPTRADLLTFCL